MAPSPRRALEDFLASDGTAEEQTAIRRSLIPGVDPALVEQIENFDLDGQLVNRTLRCYQVFGAKFALGRAGVAGGRHRAR